MTRLFDFSGMSSIEMFLLNLVWFVTLFSGVAMGCAALLPKRAVALRSHVLTAGLLLVLLAPAGAEVSRRWLGALPETSAGLSLKPAPGDASNPWPLNAIDRAPVLNDELNGVNAGSRLAPTTVYFTSRGSIGAKLIAIWLIGWFAILVREVRQSRRIARMRSQFRAADQRFRDAVSHACELIGYERAPSVLETAAGISPHVTGIVRTAIVFPQVSSMLSEEQLRAVAIHEVAHLKHGHPQLTPVRILARAVFWWHPLVHGLLKMLDDSQERVCDAHVVNAQRHGRTLAEALVEMAERIVRTEMPGLAILHRRSSLERRVSALIESKGELMTTNISRRNAVVLSSAILVGAYLVSLGGARSVVRADESAPRQTAGPSGPSDRAGPRPPVIVAEEVRTEPPRVIEGHGANPPSMIYGRSRKSSSFIDGVAVDAGLEWQGFKAYLGLLHDVVVVDNKTGRPIWKASASAFYDSLTFRNIAETPGEARWAVRLRSSLHADVQLDAYFDLRTGEKLTLPEQENRPEGEPVRLPRVWSGAEAVNDAPYEGIVADEESWHEVRKILFGDIQSSDIPGPSDVDFEKHVLLVISSGRATNCRGIGYASAYDQDNGVLIRLQYFTYQSAAFSFNDEAGPSGPGEIVEEKIERPYGLFLVPRSVGNRVVVERNMQRMIQGPAMWKRVHAFRVPAAFDR